MPVFDGQEFDAHVSEALEEKDLAEIWKGTYRLSMPNGEVWKVPIRIIAMDRARAYSSEYEGSVERSLHEDTLPLFNAQGFEIEDWAKNNMDWSDVETHAIREVEADREKERVDGWSDGEVEISRETF
jgi:hypothetical protein